MMPFPLILFNGLRDPIENNIANEHTFVSNTMLFD